MKKLLVLFLFFGMNALFSQELSLKERLVKASHDSIRCRILSDEISNTDDYDQKLMLNQKLEALVEKNLKSSILSEEAERKFLSSKITYLSNYGYIYQNAKFRDINCALKYYDQTIPIANSIGDEEGIARVYTNTGFAYEDLGNLPKAIDYYQKALRLYRKQNNLNSISVVLNNLGYVFQSQKEYEKSIKYFEECLELQNKTEKKNEQLVGFLYNNIGMSYNSLGKHKRALHYYKKAFVLFKEIKYEYGIGLLLNNIGENYMQQFNERTDKHSTEAKELLDRATSNYNESLLIWEKQEDWVSKSITLKNLGMTALNQKQYDKAIRLGVQSIELAKQTGLPKAIRSGSELLYKAYKEKGDYKNAFEMLQQYTTLNDSLVNENNRKEILEKGFAYEYSKKEILLKAQAKVQRQKNNFIYGIIIALLFLLVLFSSIWFYYYKKKQKTDKTLREAQLFLEIAAAERRRISADLHDDLGVGISTITLLSNRIKRQESIPEIRIDAQNIIENTKKVSQKLTEVIWELNEEHNNLEHLLLFIQKQGNTIFKETNITFSMIIPLEIPKVFFSSNQRKQIYLAVKECFNNAIKHSYATKVTCKIVFNGKLFFEIMDDGIGFDVTEKMSAGVGEGLKNLQYRLHNVKGELEFESSNKGTKIRIQFPLH